MQSIIGELNTYLLSNYRKFVYTYNYNEIYDDMIGRSTTLLTFGLLVTIVALCMQTANSATFIVSSDGSYQSILEAVGKSSEGDRIVVKSGTYYENVDVHKKLMVIGLDTGGGKPVIDAGGRGSGVVISADGVLLQGFEIVNSGNSWKDAGIKIKSDTCVVGRNEIRDNEYGVVLDCANENLLFNNTVCQNDVGISFYSSENCTVLNNVACNNTFSGFLLSNSKNNSLKRNNASWNHWSGFVLDECEGNLILDNVINFNENEGIWALRSSGNTFQGNGIRSNYIFGLRLYYSFTNVVMKNVVSGSLDGFSLENSNGNVFGGNDVLDNDYGMYVDTSFNNKIFMNNFINNVHGVYSWNSTSLWNYSEPKNYQYNNVPYKRRLGNFWSDYGGSDSFGDGLGDVPYVVIGFEKDLYPLMKPSNKYIIFV